LKNEEIKSEGQRCEGLHGSGFEAHDALAIVAIDIDMLDKNPAAKKLWQQNMTVPNSCARGPGLLCP
jgi:hypothetical protein